MINKLNNNYIIKSDAKDIEKFISQNEDTLRILKAMKTPLNRHFPNCKFSLELCDNLGWTTQTKLLLNVPVREEMFFNGMLNHFKEIYTEIESILEDIENTVVLFPEIENKTFERMDNDCAINLIARTAYFNNYNNGLIQREMDFREIPKNQQVNEIIEYCKTHENPNIVDIVYDLQLKLFDVDDIITELEEKGIHLNVEY